MKKLTLLLALCAIVFASCKKGDTGATGPQGSQGPTGNANVVIAEITVPPSNWKSDGNGGWDTSLTTSGFTNINKDAISIYWSSDSAYFNALPFSGTIVGLPVVNFSVINKSILIEYEPQTGIASIPKPNIKEFFNIVVVPMAVMQLHPNTNWNNANEVIQLPEVQAALKKN